MENRSTIEQALRDVLHVDTVQLTWLAGDASERTYYEVHTKNAPPLALMVLGEKDRKLLQNGTYEWVALQRFLVANQIKVPHIEHLFPALGVILLEHLGVDSLEKKVFAAKNSEEIKDLYRPIFPLLGNLLQLPPHPTYSQRAFDEALLSRELRFFKVHFLEGTLGLTLSLDEEAIFLQETTSIAAFLAKESRFFVHRDLHSRNLLIYNHAPYTIDFQDARLGSPVYDLVSLIFDPYVPISIPLRLELFDEGLDTQGYAQTGQQTTNWKPVFLQRMLKILGSYGFLGATKNRSYLAYIPPTLSFLEAVAVCDPRWPFLSRELLHRIEDTHRKLT
jgi:aminoglycoside/choline kinase family phosphotransferase